MKKTLFTLVLALSSTISFGGQEGHGGIVLKCGDKVELADFWEAKLLHKKDPKFELVSSEENVSAQVMQAFKKLASFRAAQEIGLKADDLFKVYQDMIDKARPISSDEVYWQFSDDLGLFKKIPANCSLDNVIHYLRDNYIDKREDYYEQLSMTEKAALWVHEVLYRKLRDNGQTTSHAARRITAFLFSNLEDQEVASGLILGFLSQETVFFVDRRLARNEMKFKSTVLKDDYRTIFQEFDTVWNNEVECQEYSRGLFGVKKECKELEETRNDFDKVSVRYKFSNASGTWIRLSISLDVFFKNRELKNETFLISGETGQRINSVGNYHSKPNYLMYSKFYYILSEDKTFNYFYGRN